MNWMKKRWAVLVASVVTNICIGTGFAWSVYQTGLFNESVSVFGTEVSQAQLALTALHFKNQSASQLLLTRGRTLGSYTMMLAGETVFLLCAGK